MLGPIAQAGVDLFDCSQRRFWEPTFAGSDLNLADWAKKLTGKPTLTVGSVGLDRDFMASLFEQEKSADVTDLGRLVEMFERGDFDLVGVGRALIVDPRWSAKVRDGRFDALLAYLPDALKTLT